MRNEFIKGDNLLALTQWWDLNANKYVIHSLLPLTVYKIIHVDTKNKGDFP